MPRSFNIPLVQTGARMAAKFITIKDEGNIQVQTSRHDILINNLITKYKKINKRIKLLKLGRLNMDMDGKIQLTALSFT